MIKKTKTVMSLLLMFSFLLIFSCSIKFSKLVPTKESSQTNLTKEPQVIDLQEEAKTKSEHNLEIIWERKFEGKFAAGIGSIQQTDDGGYIVAGGTCGLDSYYRYKAENYDAYILKLDSKGNLEWEKIYGGKRVDFIKSIQQTCDGGYICAGYTGSFKICEEKDTWYYGSYILKLDKKGNLEWERVFREESNHSANSIQQTKDGGYIVGGAREVTTPSGEFPYPGYILKLDKKGNLEWEKTTIGKLGSIRSVQQTRDGGYIATGEGELDFVIKFDSKGEIEWEKRNEGILLNIWIWWGNQVQQTKDGGYIVIGDIGNPIEKSEKYNDGSIIILKLDKDGNIEWGKIYNTEGGDFGNSVQQTKDGGYIVGANLDGPHFRVANPSFTPAILKLNKNGNIEWIKILKDKSVSSVIQTKNGGYVIVGTEKIERKDYKGDEDYKKTKGVIYVLKLDFEGESYKIKNVQ